MELYLMQHGSCLSKAIDPDQPLSPVGLDQIRRSATAMNRLGVCLDAVLASPKLRSQQTATIVAEALGFATKKIIITEDIKAMAPPDKAVDALRALKVDAALVVGHLPNLADLTSHLMTGTGRAHVVFDNGGLIRLDVDMLPTQAARLCWCLSPMQLQLIAGR